MAKLKVFLSSKGVEGIELSMDEAKTLYNELKSILENLNDPSKIERAPSWFYFDSWEKIAKYKRPPYRPKQPG
jgi:hypothetical protein